MIFKNKQYKNFVLKYLNDTIDSDLYPNGDITSEAIFEDINKTATAKIIAKESGIIAGIEELKWFFTNSGQWSVVSGEFFKKDGDKIKKNDIILEITSDIKTLLKIERTILNLLQRMSGIATETFKLNSQLKFAKISATRKTPLGLIDKKAVVIGGGLPHRINLSDAILIKDTHLDPFGRKNLDKAIEKVINSPLLKGVRGIAFLEIEVLNQKEAILAAKTFQKVPSTKYPARIQSGGQVPSTFIIMLDNFIQKEVKKTIDALNKKNIHQNIKIEVSGGINSKNIKKYDIQGVDIISVGYITHSAKALDLSMKIN